MANVIVCPGSDARVRANVPSGFEIADAPLAEIAASATGSPRSSWTCPRNSYVGSAEGAAIGQFGQTTQTPAATPAPTESVNPAAIQRLRVRFLPITLRNTDATWEGWVSVMPWISSIGGSGV